MASEAPIGLTTVTAIAGATSPFHVESKAPIRRPDAATNVAFRAAGVNRRVGVVCDQNIFLEQRLPWLHLIDAWVERVVRAGRLLLRRASPRQNTVPKRTGNPRHVG